MVGVCNVGIHIHILMQKYSFIDDLSSPNAHVKECTLKNQLADD